MVKYPKRQTLGGKVMIYVLVGCIAFLFGMRIGSRLRSREWLEMLTELGMVEQLKNQLSAKNKEFAAQLVKIKALLVLTKTGLAPEEVQQELETMFTEAKQLGKWLDDAKRLLD